MYFHQIICDICQEGDSFGREEATTGTASAVIHGGTNNLYFEQCVHHIYGQLQLAKYFGKILQHIGIAKDPALQNSIFFLQIALNNLPNSKI